MIPKPLSDLQIDNDFIFMLIMQNKTICTRLAEILLNIQIQDIIYDTQKTSQSFYYSKGVRFDVYIKNSNKVINIEMQSSHYKHLTMRARYYQSMLDATLLKKGQNYNELKDTYILFICKDDPFSTSQCTYTQQIICKEDPTVDLTNGTTTKFFNCSAYKKVQDPELRAFMEYVSTNKPTSTFTKTIDDIIIAEKARGVNMERYSNFNMLKMDAKEEGIQEGVQIGIQQGMQQGMQVGLQQGIQQTTKEYEAILSQLRSKLDAAGIKY